jgi:pyruvate/2-oxoglutarate dehydrogenase complex dihydrolipoamide acyltransferase (E2) component
LIARMPEYLKLPRYGTVMEEGTIVNWLKQPGDRFEAGDSLCELETEKVTAVYEAPVAGLMLEHMAAEGDSVPVGTPLCRIEPT